MSRLHLTPRVRRNLTSPTGQMRVCTEPSTLVLPRNELPAAEVVIHIHCRGWKGYNSCVTCTSHTATVGILSKLACASLCIWVSPLQGG